MKYRNLGNSGLMVSEISLGTWLTTGLGIEKQTAFEVLNKAVDSGINFLDTADMYNRGESEKVLGEFMQTIRREEVILATKVFGPMSDHWMTQGLSMRHIRNACEASLKRLQTDYIDLYQCHRYDIDTPLEETCYAMHNLVERGLILHWGVSQWTAVQITNAMRICEKNGWRKPISNQPVYNMLNRGLETDVMDVCEKEGLGLVVYSPLAQGLLTGKYRRNHTPEDSRLASTVMNAWFPTKRMTEEYWDLQDKLEALAHELNATLGELALAWILTKKPISSCITGASRPSQVDSNLGCLKLELSADIMERIEGILNNAPVDQYTGARIGYGIIKRGY
ncbi:MAG: aldo/keto reductase family protein [Bacteroidetes bacterium]|nr:aldo/keto reductase family protein [Bacteroidota bacterium]